MTGDRRFCQVWRIGGSQGSGIDRGAGLLAQALAMAGYQVAAHREFHSNIIGRHSYSDLSFGNGFVPCHPDSCDLLVCLDAESLVRHAGVIKAGGMVFHDQEYADVSLDKLHFLDQPVHDAITDLLQRGGFPLTVSGVLEMLATQGIRTIGVPFDHLIRELSRQAKAPRSRARRAVNTLAVCIPALVHGLERGHLSAAITRTFAGSPEIVTLNEAALTVADELVENITSDDDKGLPPGEISGERLWLNATQAIGLGKLTAGLGVQAYYPISPASDENVYLESACRQMSEQGIDGIPIIHQTEDEIAAIGLCCGAALAGARAATSTSGPGFSLMAEGLGWAGMTETPLVVTLYQRGGPSTGMPTRTEQGDLLPAIHAGHGEFPRMVIASTDIESCFRDALQAFDYAEHYQLPVIHLVDKTLASTTCTIAPFDVSDYQPDRGKLMSLNHSTGQRVARYQLTDDGISPRPLTGRTGQACWYTGVEHDERGLVSEDPDIRMQMMHKRARKLEQILESLTIQEKFMIEGSEDAGLVILSWGSNLDAIRHAIYLIEKKGLSARLVMVRLLQPFPADELCNLVNSHTTLISVECNHNGQFAQLLHSKTNIDIDHEILRFDGRPHTGRLLAEAIMDIAEGNAPDRVILPVSRHR